MAVLKLAKNQERRILAGHLWIYSNEVDHAYTSLSTFAPGELVTVQSAHNKQLGTAYVNPNTLLCARILSRNVKEEINLAFFVRHLTKALTRRELLFPAPYYRLVFGESDGLPGLILDRFDDVIIGQINTAGMERLQEIILAAIQQVIAPKIIIWRNDTTYRSLEGLPTYNKIIYGDHLEECLVKENDCEFYIPIMRGQKTGWFYDHRNNRQRILSYVNNKTVLDVFSYVGAFAIPVAKVATQVTCIDSSALAIEYLTNNARRNHVDSKIVAHVGDAFKLLTELLAAKKYYDVVILDPPAFIKKRKEHQTGVRVYEQLNQLALSLLKPGGVLLTASCSMHLSTPDLLNCVRRASITCKRDLAILEQLHQAPDHPVHLAIAETNYLKGFIIQ